MKIEDECLTSIFFIKNVSSSTSHKKLRVYVFPLFRLYVFSSFRLSLREFKNSLPNTFIYESILIKKNYMNANISFNQVRPQRSLKVIKCHFYVYFNLNLRSDGQLYHLVLFMLRHLSDSTINFFFNLRWCF